MSKKAKIRKIHRSAITGRFVSEDYVKKHLKTTVTETIRSLHRKQKN